MLNRPKYAQAFPFWIVQALREIGLGEQYFG